MIFFPPCDSVYVHEFSFVSNGTLITTSSTLNPFFLISPYPTVGAATVVSPVELIRTKLQAQKQSYRELTSCIRSAVQSEGWLSLWRGLGPTLLRDVPFSAMYWYNYETCKRRLCEHYHIREPTFAISFASGALSGSVSVPILVLLSLYSILLSFPTTLIETLVIMRIPLSFRSLLLLRYHLMWSKPGGRWN